MENDVLRPRLTPGMYEKIEKDVVKLYKEMDLSIPIEPLEIANRLGFIVKSIVECDIEEIVEAMKRKGLDGLSYYDKDEKTYVIVLNDNCYSKKREAFTIMHEIGHIRLGHKVSSPLAEKMANFYASYALVPSPLVKYFKAYSVDDIMEIFQVSRLCAYYCYTRFMKWVLYGGGQKHEKELMNFYESRE